MARRHADDVVVGGVGGLGVVVDLFQVEFFELVAVERDVQVG